MSRRRTTKTTRPRFVSAGRIGTVLLAAAIVWLASGLVTRMTQAYQLNSEVKGLQAENARISETNNEYQQQLQALSRPDGAEEQARQHNYVRPDEKVYVVSQPSPSPSASPATHAPAAGRPSPGSGKSFWADFWGALTSPFH